METIYFQENFEEPIVRADFFRGVLCLNTDSTGNSSAVFDKPVDGQMVHFQMPFPIRSILAFDYQMTPRIETDKDRGSFKVKVFSINPLLEPGSRVYGNPLLYGELSRSTKDSLLSFRILSKDSQTLIATSARSFHGQCHLILEQDTLLKKLKLTGFLGERDSFTFVLPDDQHRILHFSIGFTGPSFTGRNLPALLLFDNIVLSDSALQTPAPPKVKASVVDDRIQIRCEPRSEDSLLRVALYTASADSFRIIYREDIQQKFVKQTFLGIPLQSGTYIIRFCWLLGNGLRSSYSTPETLHVHKSGGKATHPAILWAHIIDEVTRDKCKELVANRWYVLETQLSQVHSCFAVFALHHMSNPFMGGKMRGGIFDSKTKYLFNFSLGDDIGCYAERDSSGMSKRLDGRKGIYIHDADDLFQRDTVEKVVRIRFKLLPESEEGPWELTGYFEANQAEPSYLLNQPFTVYSEESWERLERIRNRTRMKIAIVGMLLLISVISFFWFSKNHNRHRETSLDKVFSELTPVSLMDDFLIHSKFEHKLLVLKAERFIRENYTRPISLEDVCNHVGRSSAWVFRIFKKGTGMTVLEFINRFRVEKARDLLKNSTHSVTDIALMVGFSSIDHFGRVFKQYERKTPSDFRTASILL